MSASAIKGFILLVVLLLMQMIALFGLFGLWYASQKLKSSGSLWKREMETQVMAQLSRKLEKRFLLGAPPCLIQRVEPSKLAKMPESWWLHTGCSGNLNENGYYYYYVTESLGVDNCALVSKSDQGVMIADYYRLTIYGRRLHESQAAFVWQSTVIKLLYVALPPVCHGITHRVVAGHQMLREL